jgi:hypothetical protein
MLTYESFIADLKSKLLNILIELQSQNLIIEQIVTLKVLNVLKSFFFIYLIVLMKSVRKENKFLILISLFQNLADKKNRQRTEDVVNLARQKEAGINRNNQSEEGNKRKDKKNEDKKNGSNDENGFNDDKKCIRCDRASHSKDECSAINSECFDCHKIDH